MSPALPTIQPKSPNRQSGNRWLVPLAAIGALVAVAVIGGTLLLRPKEISEAPSVALKNSDPSLNESSSIAERDQKTAVDDGKTLWVSPTSGDAISLGYLPPGCQVFLAIRPAALLEHPEGEKILAALGPSGLQGIEEIQQTTGLPLVAMERLLIGLRAEAGGIWSMSCVVEPVDAAERAYFENAETKSHAGENYQEKGNQAMWAIDSPNGPLLVVTSLQDMPDVIDMAGTPPPLRREMESLIAASDADRHATLLFAPSYLFADGRSLFTGPAERLASLLDWFFGDGVTAVAISLHWDRDFFLELDAISNIATKPHQLARRLHGRTRELPEQTRQYLTQLNVQLYSQELIQRLPAMLGALVGTTRSGYDRRRAILRAYLPRPAGHNLLMASQLALIEPLTQRALPSMAKFGTPQSIDDRLAKVMSLTFRQETLEEALEILAGEIGVEIVLVGRDLQLDGITKNQSFGLAQRDRPAREILAEILRLANPDRGAAGLNDPRQKLVYTVKPRQLGGKKAIFVTTRAAAAERGDTLPGAFKSE